MADDLDSQSIARQTFEVARRGYEQQEVRAFLHEVSSQLERLQREASGLRERAVRAEARVGLADVPDDAVLLEVLGEETTRVLASAREAAAEIRAKAEVAAERLIAEATLEAAEARAEAVRVADQRLAEAAAESQSILAEAHSELDRRRAEAEAAAAEIRAAAGEQAQALRDEGRRERDQALEAAEADVEAARVRGREMVAEAQAVRERVLKDLAVRRKKARQQVEKLNAGRERLLQAYDVVRRTIDEATDELSSSLPEARVAADAAARRVDEEPEATVEQLDEEVTTAALVDLPIVELGDEEGDGPGPFSGEVPAIPSSEPDPVVVVSLEAEAPEEVMATDLLEPSDRRSRKARRRRGGFEDLPAGSLVRIEPQPEGEGIRILAEPAVEAEPDPEPAAAEPPPSEEPDEEPAPAEDAVDDVAPNVQDLFARLRAEREGDGEPAETTAEEPAAVIHEPAEAGAVVDDPAASDAPAVEEPAAADAVVDEPAEADAVVDASATPFRERDAALAAIDEELGRRLKRTLADEQNEVLDLLRRVKPKGVGDVLPDVDDHAARWAEVVAADLAASAAAGATWAGGQPGSTADLADELARTLTAPLRDRIDRSFVASDGNLDDVADRVRALYREWKGQRLVETSHHHTAAAYARGLYDGLGAGTEVRWVVDPQDGPCPDCDDNVLQGSLAKGEVFPTGHLCAPAHPGCRCLVLPIPG